MSTVLITIDSAVGLDTKRHTDVLDVNYGERWVEIFRRNGRTIRYPVTSVISVEER